MTADFDDEKLWADGPLCPTRARGLAGIPLGEPLNDADAIAHAHAEFHGLPSAMIYSVCAWPHCNFWEVRSFLQSNPHRPPLLPLDEIREAHGRFHSLPGALLDDEENPEVCDFDAIAQLLTNTASTETPRTPTSDSTTDRQRWPAGQSATMPAVSSTLSPPSSTPTGRGPRWPRPALAASDLHLLGDRPLSHPVDGHRNPVTYPSAGVRTCACGCGVDVVGSRVFLPGHDQRAIHDRIAQEWGTTLEFVEWFDETYGNPRASAPSEA